jgi:hypothetical protein
MVLYELLGLKSWISFKYEAYCKVLATCIVLYSRFFKIHVIFFTKIGNYADQNL